MFEPQESLFDLLEEPIRKQGYELFDVEIKKLDSRQTVQIFIDAPKGIGLEDCVTVNEVAQEVLDEHDPISDAYVLEVSSPGLFRKLKTPKHFQTQVGARIKLRLRQKAQGIKNFIGCLQECNDDGLILKLEEDGSELTIPYENITKANLEPKLDF